MMPETQGRAGLEKGLMPETQSRVGERLDTRNAEHGGERLDARNLGQG